MQVPKSKGRKNITRGLVTPESPACRWDEGPPLMIVPALISDVQVAWEHELSRRTLEHMRVKRES